MWVLQLRLILSVFLSTSLLALIDQSGGSLQNGSLFTLTIVVIAIARARYDVIWQLSALSALWMRMMTDACRFLWCCLLKEKHLLIMRLDRTMLAHVARLDEVFDVDEVHVALLLFQHKCALVLR